MDRGGSANAGHDCGTDRSPKNNSTEQRMNFIPSRRAKQKTPPGGTSGVFGPAYGDCGHRRRVNLATTTLRFRSRNFTRPAARVAMQNSKPFPCGFHSATRQLAALRLTPFSQVHRDTIVASTTTRHTTPRSMGTAGGADPTFSSRQAGIAGPARRIRYPLLRVLAARRPASPRE